MMHEKRLVKKIGNPITTTMSFVTINRICVYSFYSKCIIND